MDLIGECTIKCKGKDNNLKMKAITMIDPATGWFEIKQYDDKQVISIVQIVEQTWLSRYPWPNMITYDQGSKFIGHDFWETAKDDYAINSKPTIVWNPQANLILEWIHQVLSDHIRTYELKKYYLDDKDPWARILSATAFALWATYHTTLQAMPGQLIFVSDMIMSIKHVAN